MKNENITIHQLRLLGFRVQVIHRRIYKYLNQGNVITTPPLSHYDVSARFDPHDIIHGLQPKGGTTTVRIFYGEYDKLLWETTTICRSDETFNRKIGIEVAMKRLKEWTYSTINKMLVDNKLYIASYSEESNKYGGYCIYRDLNGKEVVCTDVCQDVNWLNKIGWPDNKVIGIVTGPCLKPKY